MKWHCFFPTTINLRVHGAWLSVCSRLMCAQCPLIRRATQCRHCFRIVICVVAYDFIVTKITAAVRWLKSKINFRKPIFEFFIGRKPVCVGDFNRQPKQRTGDATKQTSRNELFSVILFLVKWLNALAHYICIDQIALALTPRQTCVTL